MRLPKDILTGTMTKPRLFLCETDKTKICELDTIAMSGSFKFNAYSELSFSVPRTYTNITTGETQVNPFYDKIEALRLVLLEGFGYFEIQDPEITSDGIREIKNITANSLEYTLSQKYLENFNINTGEIDSIEVMYAQEHGCEVIPVTFYNPLIPGLSLLDLALEKIYGWNIGYVDDSLITMGRKFEISRTSVYDFIVQDLCDKFNCFVVFDTINNTINFYAESLISKFIGDGTTKTFTILPSYNSIGTVSIDGYKTTAYTYDVVEDDYKNKKGILTFNEAPEDGARIEVTDGSQTKWITDVYVSFDNLAQEVNISYSADDIKTVLTVRGADDLDIREVNMGLPYIVDLSYYYNVDWMGQELYDAYTAYVKNINEKQESYTNNSQEILKLQNDINFAMNRTTLGYGVDSSVSPETVGTYYIVVGGSYPNYEYQEVSLPTEYNANVTYYKLNGVNVTEDKVSTLYSAVRKFFVNAYHQSEPGITDIATRDETLDELLEELPDEFDFVAAEFDVLKQLLMTEITPENIDEVTENVSVTFRGFLDLIFEEMGLTPLNDLFLVPYTRVQEVNKDYSDPSSDYYWFYYPVTIMLASINEAIETRQKEIDELNVALENKQDENAEITESISIYNNFTPAQLVRLSSFLREDEYTDDNFVVTDIDTIETSIKIKRELSECGRIELSKLCEPKLEFSMDMANIYALPEFEPIIHQFQLGNLINVAIRPDYVKRARLLSVDINFDDFSDFSCEFGELTNLKTPSSVHADLLANALSAGKTVASNISYWNKGADMATETDLKIKQGLLSAIGGLYTADQSVLIDDKGILLRKVNEDGSFSPYQAWLRNNTILLSEDGFSETSTPSLGLGEFVVDGKTFYGILAKAILSGYIEGSTIVGGTINIGEGAFVVDEYGNVTMGGASKIGDMTVEDLQNYLSDENNIVYTSCPAHGNYLENEIWIVGEDDYIQTNNNGNVIDSSGNVITIVSMGAISDDETAVIDTDDNVIGTIQENLVVDNDANIIGVYDKPRKIASKIVGYIQDGNAVDSTGISIGNIDGVTVYNETALVGIIYGEYIIEAEITDTATVNIIEAGSVLRAVNDGNGIYKSTDWVSALGKYDKQHDTLNGKVNIIQADLDQHFEFTNDNGLVIKDGNSKVYTRLRNDRLSFIQRDADPLVGDTEVAYISDKKLHISSAEITGVDGEDGNLDVNGTTTMKELRVNSTSANNTLVIQSEANGSFSILIQM